MRVISVQTRTTTGHCGNNHLTWEQVLNTTGDGKIRRPLYFYNQNFLKKHRLKHNSQKPTPFDHAAFSHPPG